MRLTEDVAIVGGGSFTGFGLSADFDSHVYLLDGGSGYALVDCGMGTSQGLERVLARIESVGVDPAAIDRLLLTHYHTDHAGGAAVYRERLSLQVSIGADVQTALETPDHEMTQFTAGSAAGAFPAAYEYPACYRGRSAHRRRRARGWAAVCPLRLDTRPLRRPRLLSRHRWRPHLPARR